MSGALVTLLPEDVTLTVCRDVVSNMEIGLHLYHLQDRADSGSLRFLGSNAAAERIVGTPAAPALGQRMVEAFPIVLDHGIPDAYAEVVRTGRPWTNDVVYRGPGNAVTGAFSVRAVALPGDCVGALFVDATPRYRALEELRVSEARQRALLDALPDTLYRVGPDGSLHDVKRGTPGPAALALHVAAQAAEPLSPGDVRVFECTVGAEDIEVRLVHTGEDEHLAIVRDITERKRGERRKDEFISIVSHELRTPLTSIRGALGLLEGGVVGAASPPMQELVTVARTNADRLIRLINDMLDLDKMEAGGLDLELVSIDAAELVDTALAGVRGAADLAGVRLRRKADEPLAVLGDRDRLLQVLTNLLSNAVRYSPPQATVTVTVTRPAPERVRFTVQDEGPGVPPDRVDHLFRKFMQVGADTARRRGGTGLGLAISKAIVDQHGGAIALAPGERPGATFYFELSVTPEPPADVEESSVEDLFADLRAAYAASLPAQMDALLARVASSRTEPAALAEALGLAHRLKGTAGTYGLPAVSEAAAGIEQALRAVPGDPAAVQRAVEAAVRALQGAVRRE